METELTIVEYSAEHERYKCGYCGSADTNYSHGMWAHQMTVRDYQDLIDRGWRRSGMYCYKPTMNLTCCPQYPIRCHALDFKMNKSHKKAIKKVNKFLIQGSKPGPGGQIGASDEVHRDSDGLIVKERKPSSLVLSSGMQKGTENARGSISDTTVQTSVSDMTAQTMQTSVSDTKVQSMQTFVCDMQIQSFVSSQARSQSPSAKPLQDQQNEGHDRKIKSTPKPGIGPDPSKPRCRKAKEIRLQRRTLKHSDAGDSRTNQVPTKQTSEKTLEDFLDEPDHAQNLAHKLELRLIRSWPADEAIRSVLSIEHGVYHKYQTTIHKDPPHKPNQNQYKRFLCNSPLLIVLCHTVPESLQLRLSFDESYAVYQTYQMAVHKDSSQECDKFGFKSFLVDSPLEEIYDDESGPPEGYGSFHQHYILDGKLIAVAVLDILPSCVSSVYLYYDPSYSFLGLGVYSALREIALVRQLHQSAPDLKYYYMGFYIHTCPKMRYKGQFSPSYLACPETYHWVPIERCRPKLEVSKYACLSDSVSGKDEDDDVSQVLVLHKGRLLRYGSYKLMASQRADEEEVREYSHLVGRMCAQRMLLVRK